MVRETLAELDTTNLNSTIILNTGCIYKYVHFDEAQEQEVEQIGVGIIYAIHGAPNDPNALIDIRFCPPTHGKPASKNRPDSLYQDI